jgi:hypothetical protein
MTQLPADQVGRFLRYQAPELTRIWRLARAQARHDVFPGLVDGLVEAFFDRAGELLGDGAAPDEVWEGLVGVVRWPPTLAADELPQEWAILADVLAAACESVNAEPEVGAWLTRAVAAAESGTLGLAGGTGRRPPGIFTTVVFSTMAPRPEPVSSPL